MAQHPLKFVKRNISSVVGLIPNKKKMLEVDESDRQFAQCLDIARKAINGEIGDNTGGATEYHTKAIKPNWNWSKLQKTASIGDHIFYKTIA